MSFHYPLPQLLKPFPSWPSYSLLYSLKPSLSEFQRCSIFRFFRFFVCCPEFRLSKFKNGGKQISLPPNHIGVNKVSFTQISVKVNQWTVKRLERYLVMSGLTTEWSRHGGSHVGQKHAWEKIVLNFYFSWTVNSKKYAVLPTLSSTY